MANEENLIPYEKGQSGNPKGRPKGSKNRSSVAKKWLSVEQDLKNPLTSEIETMSQEDLMTLALIKKARDGEQIEQTNIEQPLFPDVSKDNGNR